MGEISTASRTEEALRDIDKESIRSKLEAKEQLRQTSASKSRKLFPKKPLHGNHQTPEVSFSGEEGDLGFSPEQFLPPGKILG